MKLTKTEAAAFAAIGKALCCAKDCAARKKEAMPLVKAVLAENHEEFVDEGVTIGDYRFKLVVREELAAIRV